MNNYKGMVVFASVVQHGSMSAAARALGISASAVSQQVRQLEREAGVSLLHRSTRQLSLTDIGQRYHAQCAHLAQAAELAQAELAAAREAPGGELRLSCTVGFARHVAPALAPWLAQHPALRLHLSVDDAPIDLIQARIDLAVRFGRLPDSNWRARRLGVMQWWLCTSPQWLAQQKSPPSHPAPLTSARWLGLVRDSSAPGSASIQAEVRHLHSQESHALHVVPHIASNNQLSLQQMCEQGLGLALLGSMDVAPAVEQGRLVRLLADWSFGELPIWALTPERQTQAAKLRQSLQVLQAYVAQLPGVHKTAPGP